MIAIVSQAGITIIRWDAADAIKAVVEGGGRAVGIYAMCKGGKYLCGIYPDFEQAAHAIDGLREAVARGEDSYTFPPADKEYRGEDAEKDL